MPRGPGLAKATRAALRRRPGGWALSRDAEETIFALAERMSEGSVRRGDDGSDTYYGSTMFTVPLDALRARWRSTLPVETLRDLVEGSVRVRLRAMRIARAEAAHRVPDQGFGTAQVETRVAIVDDSLHLDVDLEVPLDVSSRRRSTP